MSTISGNDYIKKGYLQGIYIFNNYIKFNYLILYMFEMTMAKKSI